jgi:diaminopimelate decarboxylase
MDLSWRSLRELEAEYGDSLFFLDLNAFTDNYREFLTAFRSIYAHSNIAYSYKTNYTPRMCQRVKAMDGYAEVVSSMEYELALRIGMMPHRIIFNGPYKTAMDVEHALLSGATVNLDSFEEVRLVEAISRRSPGHQLNVGIRCNFDLGSDFVSRFGFDVDDGAFKTIFETLSNLTNCLVAGFHCHFSTAHRSAESYAWRTRRMLALVNEYFGEPGPQFINVGGGFFSKMPAPLRTQFSVPVPTFQDYAEAIATECLQAFSGGKTPELILEPGSALTADVMSFAAKIVGIKTVRSRTVALASGSVHNIKPTLHTKNLPLRIVSRNTVASTPLSGPIDIVGYTCMEHDCLCSGYEGPIAVDDFVWFDNVGAYTTVMKPPFIRPSPPILGYDESSGQIEVIKRQETLHDLFSTYVFD